MSGRKVSIPYEYAINNLSNLTDEAVDTIQTLIEDNLYSDTEANKLKEELVNLGKYKERKVVSYERAKELIRNNMDNGFKIDKETFKSCIRAIIETTLKNRDVKFGKGVYFGKGSNTQGFYAGNSENARKAIWVNDKLIDQFIQSKVNDKNKTKIFETIFHEMKHATQYSNMNKGKIDFLTYNFIKENIIIEYDQDFYDANYQKIFIEEDSRQFRYNRFYEISKRSWNT